MYPMDKFSAIMWLETVIQAQAGNEQEMERLKVENQIRQENGQPTVEEELIELTKNVD